jgi:protein-tyrosine-phosphatase
MTRKTRRTAGWTLALSFSLAAAGFVSGAGTNQQSSNAPVPTSVLTERGKRTWNDVRVLADDSMEGRRAGSAGHRRAAAYVAEQFQRAGLQPGGDGGFLQPVKLQSREIIEAQSSLALRRGDLSRELTLGDDAIFSLRGNYAARLDAPLVFAGHGLKLPQYGVDDLAGLDLEGKVVVAFNSAPASMPGAAGAHFGATAERWKVYRAAGAVGILLIPNPFNMDLPWERVARNRLEPFMALADPAEDQFPGMQVWATLNPARLALLLEGTGQSADELLARLKAGERLPHFALPARLLATIAAQVTQITSENVVGVLRGADPKAREERVVVSAHLDHLGIGKEGKGDRLFNGAMDNASGVAVLMQIARDLQTQKTRPRRTLMFVAVTAEESGLLGSRAFVTRARREHLHVVADLNTDMFLPLYPMKQLVVFGLEESELGEDARAVAESLQINVQPDPQPLRNRFIRSDQYSFIRAGIPSLAMKVGFDAGTPEAEIERKWFAERYHAPADAPDQPVDLGAVGAYEAVLERLALRVANRQQPPRWHPSSVFGAPSSPGTSAQAAAPTSVLMVCEHGSVKSLMAASLFNQAAAQRNLPFRAVARGVNPDTAVPAPIARALGKEGFDVKAFVPTRVSEGDIVGAASVVAIGVDLKNLAPAAHPAIESWNDVPAATVDYTAARASLKRHVDRLLAELQAKQPR